MDRNLLKKRPPKRHIIHIILALMLGFSEAAVTLFYKDKTLSAYRGLNLAKSQNKIFKTTVRDN